jgi:predicted acyltransferase
MQTSTVPPERFVSLDIFRGLIVLVMVFVNDVSGVAGLPWWTYHMPEGHNGMTYVDMVFPSFLFIVGISIPLAIRRRIAKGDSPRQLWAHVLARSASLVIIGLLLANLSNVDVQLTGISMRKWAMLAFAGIFLFWNVYPSSGRHKSWYAVLRSTGLLLLFGAVVIFRRRIGQNNAGTLDFSYPEILGLIGFAYLSVCILYLSLRKRIWVFVGALIVLNLLNVASKVGPLRWLERVPLYLWPFGTGDCPSITMAGLIASMLFFEKSVAVTLKAKAVWAVGYAVTLFGAGWALAPLGISKNSGTPSWCLYSAATSVLIFLAVYWLADIKHWTRWAALVKPAGSNTLLTYLLPWVCYVTPVLGRVSASGSQGAVGVLRALLFTGFILALAAILTKLKVRLQL